MSIRVLLQLTKAIGVLYPVFTIRCLSSGRVARYLIECHVRPVHDIDAPERRILDEEFLDRHIRDIPEYEWHGAARLCIPRFCCVPRIAIAMDATGAEAVDLDMITGKNERRPVVLEVNGVGIIAPGLDVRRELRQSFQHPSRLFIRPSGSNIPSRFHASRCEHRLPQD